MKATKLKATKQESISSRARAFASATLLVVCLLCVFATTAHGDVSAEPTDPVARKHRTTGNRLYRVREFEKAIEEYKAGALRDGAAVFHYNLAQCYRQLGRHEEALWHYERFLQLGTPTGQLEQVTRKFIDEMRSELEKKAMRQPVPPAAPDVASSGQTLPGGPLTVNPPARSASVSVGATQNVVARSPRSPQWYADTFGWGMTGTGGAAIGASGLLFLNASRLISQANSEPNQQARGELHDKADTRRLLGTVIMVGGVALITTGVLKLAITDGKRSSRTTLGIGKSGPALFGRF
jgi:tetratricopeptide (TPR) repeat protein